MAVACTRWGIYSHAGLESCADSLVSLGDGGEGFTVERVVDDPESIGASIGGLVIVTAASDLDATLHLLGTMQRRHPGCAIVCAAPDLGMAALSALVRAGVRDFVCLPTSAPELFVRLSRAAGPLEELPCEAARPGSDSEIRGFVHVSAACALVAAQLPVMARCQANVLISGETGTGKEVCAQAVHYLSSRAAQPWVAVNCAAIPADLVENELFGHAKGAYTAAHAAHAGIVREAAGGTLFLDEVDCLPLAAQAKLLRLLQEREFRPVGAQAALSADVRVIAASNSDLRQLARDGRFRQDLFFRLNVLNVRLPALRERREDIPVLALHFLREFSQEFARPVPGLSPTALRKLLAHAWPGNVRELRHTIERAVLLAPGSLLRAEDLDIDDGAPAEPVADDESFQVAKSRVVDTFERDYIEQALLLHRGNVTHAALAAKKDRRAFFELIRKHRIEPERFRQRAA